MSNLEQQWNNRRWGLLALPLLAIIILAFVFIGVGRDAERAEAAGRFIQIVKVDRATGAPLPGACFGVWDSTNIIRFEKVCDNGPGDLDLTPGFIVIKSECITLCPICHVIEQSAPPGFNLKQIKWRCDFRFGDCRLVIPNDPKPPTPTPTVTPTPTPTPPLPSEINILKQNVQVALPDACFEVRDAANVVALFTVCDNDFQGADSHPVCNADGTLLCEDSDPTDGSIRVSVDPGNYNVVEVKPPPGHVLNASKLPCNAKTAKCDLVFKNASISNPWFPWDLNGDKAVAFADFLVLLQHFGQRK